MINKKRTSGLMSVKYLFALPVVALMLVGNAQNTFSRQIERVVEENIQSPVAEIPQNKDKVYTAVEQMPQYTGGDQAMMEYIMMNLRYPESAAKEKIEGRVIIRFVVSKTGEVSDVTTVRSLDPRCDEEAMRVVRSMPKWTPGKQNGKDVDVYYTLPVLFKLKGSDQKSAPLSQSEQQGVELSEVIAVAN